MNIGLSVTGRVPLTSLRFKPLNGTANALSKSVAYHQTHDLYFLSLDSIENKYGKVNSISRGGRNNGGKLCSTYLNANMHTPLFIKHDSISKNKVTELFKGSLFTMWLQGSNFNRCAA